MRYEIFNEINKDDPEYMTQNHMEGVFREAAQASLDNKVSLNDSLDPKFLDCSNEAGSLTMVFHTEPWMINTGGSMHGGMIAACCDMTMGLLVRYFKCSKQSVTVHLGVEYARDVPPEGDIAVKATMEKAGNMIYFLTAKVYRSTDEQMAAMATAEFV